ncbi:hypothetical protein SapgrDRAFT_0187 [Saprospira grandis DSM 2844]|uniref:Uncharacterized protein n=1 Tax=Saprospira grandis DSM 2844 TaxID=694433 RepID=J0XSQ1_9BACT|nr:hypothetical protein SapgrDRAFT_0187 [Saprospira grandis DSM 2844]
MSGLAMGSSAAQPQTKQKTCFFAQGRADLRAVDRSADERSEAEAPKKSKAVCQGEKLFFPKVHYLEPTARLWKKTITRNKKSLFF